MTSPSSETEGTAGTPAATTDEVAEAVAAAIAEITAEAIPETPAEPIEEVDDGLAMARARKILEISVNSLTLLCGTEGADDEAGRTSAAIQSVVITAAKRLRMLLGARS